MSFLKAPSTEFLDILRRAGSHNKAEAFEAQLQIAKAIELPLRQGVLAGDVTGNIYEKMVMQPGTSTEFPLDLLSPGEEVDFVAWTNPGHGRIPERSPEAQSEGYVGYVLLTLSPLYSPEGFRARLACLIHTASVRSEPGSNPSNWFVGCLEIFGPVPRLRAAQ